MKDQILVKNFKFLGDLGNVYADPGFANKMLKWQAKLTLDDMCTDLWRWQSMNPNGYRPKPA